MSNTNNNLQTQTSNSLHNAIMEAGGKDRPPMLAPGNYVQWKSIIKRYIDTKPNNELIRYCLVNPPHKFTWVEQTIPVSEGSSETRTKGSQQAATKNRGKAIVNSHPPTYDQEPGMVAEDDALSKEKEIDKLMALISLSFKKIYKPTNNNLRTSSNTSTTNQDNTPRTNIVIGYDNQRVVNVAGSRETVEVTPDAADNSGPIFDAKPLQKNEQGDNNIIIDSLDMSTNGDQNDHDDDDLAKERNFLASLIEELKCEINDSKDRNKLLESSNKILVEKLKSQIKDLKNTNKCLESSNTHFKEAKTELSKTNQLMFQDLKKFQAELNRYHDVNYASKVEIKCAKAKGELVLHKISSEKSFNEYTRKINDLNQTISEMIKELIANQESISIMSQEKEAQKKFYKTREDKELEKVIALENKIKVLDDIVYKTGQSIQTMNMLNRNCKTSFVKPEFLKKAQRANPRLYDIGFYNDNLALMLALEFDETLCLAQESRSKLSDLIKPFDYKNLDSLYDLFVP
ncbi:hypothetical protein Tco_1546206 [Tanacetum coccineum]